MSSGGNRDTLTAAAKHAKAMLNSAGHAGGVPASEAAGQVIDMIQSIREPGAFRQLLAEGTTFKEKSLMAGGAVVAVDGLRRAVTRDEDGKRHLVRGVSQAAIGMGMFAATLIAKRNISGNDGPER